MTAAATAAAAEAEAEVALAVTDIEVRYAGVRAVRGVSLTARRGQVLALIGPNGAGKTTLFDAISGVRPPDAGHVDFGGHDVTQASAVRRSRLGLRRTFQRQQVFGGLTVEDNLLCACEWRGGGGGVLADMVAMPSRRRRERERRDQLETLIQQCGLSHLRHLPANALPIGQARMLELARALAGEPTVLLLDEPTSGLGEHEVDMVTAVIERTKATGTCAIVLIEHDISFVMRHANQVVVLVRGEVLAQGTPADIHSDERVRAAYLA